MVQQKVAFI